MVHGSAPVGEQWGKSGKGGSWRFEKLSLVVVPKTSNREDEMSVARRKESFVCRRIRSPHENVG
jgi:hypothetical protein